MPPIRCFCLAVILLCLPDHHDRRGGAPPWGSPLWCLRPLRVRVATFATVVIGVSSALLASRSGSVVRRRGTTGRTPMLAHAVVDGRLQRPHQPSWSPARRTADRAPGADGYLQTRAGMDGPEFHVLARVSASGAMFDGVGQRPDHRVLGPRDPLDLPLRPGGLQPSAGGFGGGRAQVLHPGGGSPRPCFLYGIALTYGATGSTNLTQIVDSLAKNTVLHQRTLVGRPGPARRGLRLQGVRRALPHVDARRLPRCPPARSPGFMASVAKAGAFAAMFRVLISSFGWSHRLHPIIYALAVLSLLLGSILALLQRATSNACWPTRRSITLASSSSASNLGSHCPRGPVRRCTTSSSTPS